MESKAFLRSTDLESRCVIALGFFDGVHLGHGGLLRMAKRRAAEMGLPAMALSFETHPATLITGHSVPLLTTKQEREKLLRAQYQMDQVVFLPFDPAMMETPWETFFHKILIEKFHAAAVVCGHDYRFGYRGEGTPEKLQYACRVHGIGCDVIARITLGGITVSSSCIREMLRSGDVARARRFLGHPYTLSGVVCHGAALGRTIGIPTANIVPASEVLLPKRGVYITTAYTKEGSFPALTNIGCRPTVDGGCIAVESWLLDYEGDLYGQELRLELQSYLRPERKFDTLCDLQTEIKNNALAARSFFAQGDSAENEEQI